MPPRKETVWLLFEDSRWRGPDFLGAFSSASLAEKWFEKRYSLKPEWEKVSAIWWRATLIYSELRLQRASVIDNAYMKKLK